MNAEPIVGGSAAHFGTKDILINQEREAIAPDGEQNFPYPDGSIIVKPVYRSDQDFIGIFALMRKEAGSNPAANDWTFIEYSRRDRRRRIHGARTEANSAKTVISGVQGHRLCVSAARVIDEKFVNFEFAADEASTYVSVKETEF